MAVPPPTPLPRFRRATTIAVLLGPASGAAPAITDRCDYLRPISLTRDFGGGTLDSITLDFDLDRYGRRLQDTSLPSGHNRIVEVRVENPVTGNLDQVLGWGKLARQPQSIGSGEKVGFVARLDHFLFGKRLVGYPVYEPISAAATIVRKPITANPVIDDTRQPNRSDQVGTHGQRLFLDPESLRTAGATTLQAAAATFWDLATLIETVCWLLNPDETWFKNPTLADLQAVLGIGSTLLRDHDIPLGASLPEALDAILAPHNYTWFVRHSVATGDAALPRTSTIVVAERGQGLATTLRLQRIDDLIDSSETNVDSISIAYDIAARPNVIIGRSALRLREGTFELRPAWPDDENDLSLADLTDDGEKHDHPRALKEFALNEAGDYTGTRTEWTSCTDLEPLFGTPTVPCRRRFKPALTQGLDRKPIGRNGYLAEWHDGTDWHDLTEDFSVLAHECGIRIGTPSEALVDRFRVVRRESPPPPFIRITCCIEGDDCFEVTVARRPESANGSDIPRLYDLSHKFKDSSISNGGFGSEQYAERHEAITAATITPTSSLTVAADLTVDNKLAVGDRLAVIGSTANDGVYHVQSFSLAGTDTVIVTREPLADATGNGVLAYLTDEEKPDTVLKIYCEEIQRDEDFVVIHADALLFGINHPEYDLGQIVVNVTQRNLSLDSYAAAAVTQRHPQITRLTYQFDGKQSLALTLDQFDRTGDRRFQKVRTR